MRESNERLYKQRLREQAPLRAAPHQYAAIDKTPYLLEYLTEILQHCPTDGARTLETGIGLGYGAIWLSKHGIAARGIDATEALIERIRQINNMLEGHAQFTRGDLFQLHPSLHDSETDTAPLLDRYDVIHHMGLLGHFTGPEIRAVLAQQVTLAKYVIFSVPSVFSESLSNDGHLLPLEEWERLLAPFDIEQLRYYGDPDTGEQAHILAILKGQPETGALRNLMAVPDEPYLPGISAIIHTRNEEDNLPDALRSLQRWTDEIIVCDMESEDDTVKIAEEAGAVIVRHPLIGNFDQARNVSAIRARHRWVFYLDADERVPRQLGRTLRLLIQAKPNDFEALQLPFQHHFAGQWMRCLYPGYKGSQLLRNGKFFWRTRLHQGVAVEGRTSRLPADDPSMAIIHYSYDNLAHYLTKLNRYTDTESENLHRDKREFHWTRAIGHFVEDFHAYEAQGALEKDGVHGLLYAFLSGFYRFEQWAKLYERRYKAGELQQNEQQAPASVEEVLTYMLQHLHEHKTARQRRGHRAAPKIDIASDAAVASEAADVVWSGPLDSTSGYGEESRNFLNALDELGVAVAANALPWGKDIVDRSPAEQIRYEELTSRPAAPGFVHIIHDFPPAFFRHPEAGMVVGRSMFETDRMPKDWVPACNSMDAIWVPSEFNRQTFRQAGVQADKISVVPECYDAAAFDALLAEPLPEREDQTFRFLSVFDWTLHKGWDALLASFLKAFEGRDDVKLIFKVWSTTGHYTPQDILHQASAWVRENLGGHDLLTDPGVSFVFDRLTRRDLLRLYRSVDAFVLPSRGEGWGRPYQEAMALGLPTIGTNWSGNTAFMTDENSYLIRHEVVPVSPSGWREIPSYKGHRWAEPDQAHLAEILQRVVAERHGEAAAIGAHAREDMRARFSRPVVGAQIVREIARLREIHCPHPILISNPSTTDSLLVTPDLEQRQPVRVRWEGKQFSWHSLAHVNRELCIQLMDRGRTELTLVPTGSNEFDPAQVDARWQRLEGRIFAPLQGGPAQVHVRHHFPSRFEQPDEGAFVLIQAWEYGYLPEAWVRSIQERVDEVWCHTEYIRNIYRESGVSADKLQIVPHGVDADIFSPDAPPFIPTDEPGAERWLALNASHEEEAPFVFLFLGGTLSRKGIDILLDAYISGFSASDNVVLLIKDTGAQGLYRNENARDRILSLTQYTTLPPIVYLEEEVTPHSLAGIYTAADCFVMPYRGEGFCLPVLEAMSCGLPAIVTAGGATDDFVDDTVGWRVPAERKPFHSDWLDRWNCVGPTWLLEVDPDELAARMQEAYRDREEVRRRGQAAAERVRNGWTWAHAAQRVEERLIALAERKKDPPVLL